MPKKPVSTYKLTNAQAEKDSEVFGVIIAGIKSSTKQLKRGLSAMETSRAMCAVGAGLRGVNGTHDSDILKKAQAAIPSTKHQTVPLIKFASFMGVTNNYACGVNDGFEDSFESEYFYKDVNRNSIEYERGWHVGQAIAYEFGY